MTGHAYEIVKMDSGHHRAGHFGLLVDGLDSWNYVDPSKFTGGPDRPKSSFVKAMAEGITDQQALAIRIDQLNAERATAALQRRIERIKAGTYGTSKTTVDGGTASDMARRKRVSEDQALEKFLNRGKLAGRDKAWRSEELKKKADRSGADTQKEWFDRRMALIANRTERLKAALARFAGADQFADDILSRAQLAVAIEVAAAELAKRFTENHKAARNARMLAEELGGLYVGAIDGVVAATHGFQEAYVEYLTGTVDLSTDDIRIFPLMTNTTADTERDGVDTFSEITTPDEFDGSNYSTGGLALDGQAVAVDDANDRAEFDATDETVSALGAGTRSIQGVVIGKFDTNFSSSRPLHWNEFASNKTPDGSDFTFVFNAEGLLNMQDG
jgi:hypothetical protein